MEVENGVSPTREENGVGVVRRLELNRISHSSRKQWCEWAQEQGPEHRCLPRKALTGIGRGYIRRHRAEPVAPDDDPTGGDERGGDERGGGRRGGGRRGGGRRPR